MMAQTSRRSFIKTGCALAAGTAVSGLTVLNADKAQASSWQHPYGYITLDVETTRQLGYDGYKGITLADGLTHKHCAFATFNALISQLAAADPSGPYAGIPTQMMEWASGGIAGFASFCGALNGACAAIGVICSNADAKLFVSDLLSWYSESLLPTNIINPTGDIAQSISGSDLCHTSVTNWCLASGFASGSSERSERCARLAGDVAAKAAALLNGGALGLTVPGDKTVCRACHYKGTDFNGGQFTRGKMDCLACHVDLKKVSARGHKKGSKP